MPITTKRALPWYSGVDDERRSDGAAQGHPLDGEGDPMAAERGTQPHETAPEQCADGEGSQGDDVGEYRQALSRAPRADGEGQIHQVAGHDLGEDLTQS